MRLLKIPWKNMDTPAVLRFAALDAGATPLERLRSDNEAALQRALAAAVAERECTLVLPHRLTTLLTHVFPSGLSALGSVTECVELTDELSHVHCHTVVYLTPAHVEDVRAIATHAGLLLSVEPKERAFVMLVLGHWTPMCTEVLNHQQLSESFHIEEVDVGFVPLDSDLATLGRERCLFDCLLHGNKSVLVDVAAALQQLQRLYGPFDHIKYKGELSAFVFQQLMDMDVGNADQKREPSADGCESRTATIAKKPKRLPPGVTHTLVLLDRTVDLATVVSSPLTLEALVDELCESRDGFATLPVVVNDDSATPPRAHADQMLPLNASDPIFQRVRGLNIQAVLPALNAEASSVKTKYDHFRATSSTASTAEVHEFVKSVPQIKAKQESLERLVALTETIETTTGSRAFRAQWQLERAIMDLKPETDDVEELFSQMEDMIFRHAPLLQVLRVVCLYSVVHDGIPPDDLGRLRMRLLQTYGHELIFSFANLKRMGLLREATTSRSLFGMAASSSFWKRPSSSFVEIAAVLRAIDLDVDVLAPSNMAFVTAGYAPISCLLVEELLKSASWEAIDATMNRIRGPRAEIKTKTRRRKATAEKKEENASSPPLIKPHVMVVCFVGGVTYMEIAALRWLSQFCACVWGWHVCDVSPH
jgi:vacuolar protein sorting-associated protein 33A